MKSGIKAGGPTTVAREESSGIGKLQGCQCWKPRHWATQAKKLNLQISTGGEAKGMTNAFTFVFSLCQSKTSCREMRRKKGRVNEGPKNSKCHLHFN